MAQQYPPATQPAYPPQGVGVNVGYPTQPGYQPVPSQFPTGKLPCTLIQYVMAGSGGGKLKLADWQQFVNMPPN